MTESNQPGRPVSASKTEMTEIVFPNDANPLGNIMGGRVMHWIDICAGIAAGRWGHATRAPSSGGSLTLPASVT